MGLASIASIRYNYEEKNSVKNFEVTIRECITNMIATRLTFDKFFYLSYECCIAKVSALTLRNKATKVLTDRLCASDIRPEMAF